MKRSELVFVTYPNTWNRDTGIIRVESVEPHSGKHSIVGDLVLYLNEVNHSPDGFGWGYHGSGPSQTAYAMLRRVCGNKTTAQAFYQQFKNEVIASLHGRWELSLDFVTDWIHQRQQELTEKAKKEKS